MDKINLDYIINLEDVTINNLKVDSFNIIEGDWIYLSGDMANLNDFYKLITCQSDLAQGKLLINGTHISTLNESKKYEIRKMISYLPLDTSQSINENEIINHISLLTDKSTSQSKKVLDDLINDLAFSPQIKNSSFAQHVFKALATKPKVLFVNFSFDHFNPVHIKEYIHPIYEYATKTGLAVIICTNNPIIQDTYRSRSYHLN